MRPPATSLKSWAWSISNIAARLTSGRNWPAQSGLYATFRKRLAGDADALFAQIPRKRRAELRKALSSELVVERTEDLDGFHRLYAWSMHRHGTPAQPLAWFRALQRSFGAACECTLVRRERTPVSGVLTFRFRDAVLPYYAGASDGARSLRANDLMYWDLMRRTCERGGGAFDFGRSKTRHGRLSTTSGAGASSLSRCITSTCCCEDARFPRSTRSTRNTGCW